MTGRAHALDVVPGLRELAAAQYGVIRRDQLAALGVTSRHVRGQLRGERWRAVGPHVLVLGTGGLTRTQQLVIGLAHVGRGAVLGGRSALEVDGLRGWEHAHIHLLVPPEARPPRLPGLVVHRTSTLPAAHVRATGVLARTCPARAAVDAASWERSPRIASGLVLAAVQQRLATAAEVVSVLADLPRARHRQVLLQALGDAEAGAESRAEADVARLVARAGLGVPSRQVLIRTPDGPRRVDLLVALPDGRSLVIEVDGPHHLDPRIQAADAARDAALLALGYVVLRIPVAALRQDPRAVLESLRALR